MAKISLVRLDSRLIHGQVITKWVKIAKANRIIIIDSSNVQSDNRIEQFQADVLSTVSRPH